MPRFGIAGSHSYSFPLVCAILVAALLEASQPNVVVILSDDQGWGDLSLNGNTDLATPNIDSLAHGGARFDRFYVCPVCSPTRAEFLTGRYHPRSGVYSTSAGGERMDLDETTIADTFKAAGYATGAFGKWHNGMQYPYHPNGRGFDEFYGFCSGHWGQYFDPMLEHNGQIVRGEGFVIDDFTDKAMAFIQRNRDQPFFAYIAYNTPHSPMQVPDRWWEKFKNRKLERHHRDPEKEDPGHQRAALAMCENIDWNVGRLLKTLDQLDLAQNTIVVYFCDNGPNGWRWNGGMKGRKGSTDEGGVRSPMLIRWPGRIQPGTVVRSYGGAIDLLPTLADFAGVDLVNAKPLDGISLKPALFGEPRADTHRLLFSCWRDRVSVRSGPYRLDHRGKLYDLTQDPGQDRDLSKEQPQVTTRLKTAVAQWRKEVLSELGRDTRPFVIGHPDYRYTQIPARDGKASGEIQRSNRFPNCSYFTNWTRIEDTITWDAEVLATGRYEVEVYYTCPPGDVGATLELSFNEAKLRGKITEAHDPPLRGAEHDRVRRMESYVKDFKALPLGTIELKKGKGTLTIRALDNPGGQIMEFRLLMLKRMGELPKVRVSNVRRAFHNGEHNAFTDLVRFQGRFYLTFRSCPDGHSVHPTASVIVLSSTDAERWEQVHRFRVPKRDTRDPHFLVFGGKLFVYTGTWYSGERSLPSSQWDLNQHLGYAAWSADGREWKGPVLLEGTFGHYIWRANTFGGKAYLCARRKIGFAVGPKGEGHEVESLMLESDDGLIWQRRAVFQAEQGDETAFQFDGDGRVVAIGRRGRATAQLCVSRPPYTDWERSDLRRYVGGPLLIRWGNRYVVGGRNSTEDRGPKTSLCWLEEGELHEFAELPSGGDNSYPGFVELSPDRALVSWYSSHEKDEDGRTITAIYLAELELAE